MDITINSPKTKICSTCKKRKPLRKFYIKNRVKNGKQIPGISGSCKTCINTIQKKERIENKERFSEREKKSRHNKSKVIQQIKESTPCLDCGNYYPYYVMDFDHRPGEKKFASVSTMVSLRYSMEVILNEIKKCDLVCANCHRIRTNKQIIFNKPRIKPPSKKTKTRKRISLGQTSFINL